MKGNAKTLRTLTAVAIIIIISIGFLTHWGIGTISAPGIWDISLLCPIGALGTMLASKMMVPRAIISLIIVIALIIIFARVFCGWLCPVPIVEKIRHVFTKKPNPDTLKIPENVEKAASDKMAYEAVVEGSATADDNSVTAAQVNASEKAAATVVTATEAAVTPEMAAAAVASTPLSAEESAALSSACQKSATGSCAGCPKRGDHVDSRHFVLGGALLSSFIFGFPIFCLVCPLGLTFATILLLINLFTQGAVTWSIIVVPTILLIEVVFFRKWCHKLCPIGAFMSLFGKLNKTFVPTINDDTCLETSKGHECGRCGAVCPEGIDPRHPNISEAAWSECTKCRACVDACPTNSITMPFMPRKKSTTSGSAGIQGSGTTGSSISDSSGGSSSGVEPVTMAVPLIDRGENGTLKS